MLLHLLADEQLPEAMSDILFLPIILTLVALAIFYVGWWWERRSEKKAPWKWVSVVPIAIALWFGWGYFYRWISEPFYQSAVGAGAYKKMLAAHWGSVLIPLLGLVALFLFQRFGDRLNLAAED